MWKLIFLACFLLLGGASYAQYFQFSQYNFTAQRVNPAIVASSNYASLSFDYRNQATGGDFNLKSNILSAAYPLLNRKNGRRWAGLGISMMDDRSGQAGIFNTQEVGLTYAANVFLSSYQTLSLGVKGLYSSRKFDLNGLHTGSQYVADRGFDESVFNGENLQYLQLNYMTLSAGLYWQQTDRKLNELAYWGLSLFDFNKPKDTFTSHESQLGTTLVAQGGLQIYNRANVSVMPEFLYTRNLSNQVLNIGAVTSYQLHPQNNEPASRLDLITKYVIGRSGILGLQWHKENFSIGCSYDHPLFKKNVGNLGAFELGMEIRRLVNPRLRNKKSANKNKSTNNRVTANRKLSTGQPGKNKSLVTKNTSTDSTKQKQSLAAKKTMRENLQQKQDSVIAHAQAGRISHEPLIIEKVTLYFNFEFNSIDLDENSTKQMDDLSAALQENEHLKIKLIGHTDNIGSARFNQRLSLYRADVIKDYLVKNGISPSRVITEGKGLTEPLNENKTEEERSKNRRVELTILYED